MDYAKIDTFQKLKQKPSNYNIKTFDCVYESLNVVVLVKLEPLYIREFWIDGEHLLCRCLLQRGASRFYQYKSFYVSQLRVSYRILGKVLPLGNHHMLLFVCLFQYFLPLKRIGGLESTH